MISFKKLTVKLNTSVVLKHVKTQIRSCQLSTTLLSLLHLAFPWSEVRGQRSEVRLRYSNKMLGIVAPFHCKNLTKQHSVGGGTPSYTNLQIVIGQEIVSSHQNSETVTTTNTMVTTILFFYIYPSFLVMLLLSIRLLQFQYDFLIKQSPLSVCQNPDEKKILVFYSRSPPCAQSFCLSGCTQAAQITL